MDSHCEMSKQWIEPLLEAVQKDRKTFAVPSIDHIDFENFKISRHTQDFIGGFDWELAFKWDFPMDSQIEAINNPNKTLNDGLESPVMCGGIFTIDKGKNSKAKVLSFSTKSRMVSRNR